MNCHGLVFKGSRAPSGAPIFGVEDDHAWLLVSDDHTSMDWGSSSTVSSRQRLAWFILDKVAGETFASAFAFDLAAMLGALDDVDWSLTELDIHRFIDKAIWRAVGMEVPR